MLEKNRKIEKMCASNYHKLDGDSIKNITKLKTIYRKNIQIISLTKAT